MAKKRGKPGGPREADPNLAAKSFIDRVIRKTEGLPEPEKPKPKNQKAVLAGRAGGPTGGKARAQTLSAERRREIARKAAKSRWSA